MTPTGVNVGVHRLEPVVVVDVAFATQELREVRRALLQVPPRFKINPRQLLVGFYAVAIEVLKSITIFRESNPMSVIRTIFVEDYTVIDRIGQELLQAFEVSALGVSNDFRIFRLISESDTAR